MKRKTLESFVPIASKDLPKFLGKPIHLSWAWHGTVWILDHIDGEVLHLHTPKTGKKLIAKAKDACYVRRYQPQK